MVNVKKWEENINTWLSEIHIQHKMAVSVDCVVFGYTGEDLYLLVMKCNMPPFEGLFSLVGDLVHADESLRDAASRVLKQKANVESVHLEQVEVFSDVHRHPMARVITVAYFALVNIENYDIKDTERRELTWVNVNQINKMAFDHMGIYEKCFSKLQRRIVNEPVGFKLLPNKFTIKDLQGLFELILQVPIDKRNFRRKLNDLNLLIEEDDMQQGVNHRPAKLFSFNDKVEKKNLNLVPNFKG